MNQSEITSYLEETIGLLAAHFGAERVRDALAKVTNGAIPASGPKNRGRNGKSETPGSASVTITLEQLRSVDQEKHGLLVEFYARLKDRNILPESQDIRHFALLIGLTDIRGKSRKEMISGLIRFMSEQPTQRLQIDLEKAEGISEHNRRQGFSVLADRLMGEGSSK